MKYLVFVALGGAAGAVGRYSLARWVHSLWQGSWPLGTLLVNLSGCALMGIVFVLVERTALHPDWRSVLMVGFLGAFTTYSTFSLEAFELWQAGQGGVAIGYMVLTTVGCVLAAASGIQLTRALL
ncbi:MAG: fluoride efflux transporter CrcB [Chromatocurvus sp.]